MKPLPPIAKQEYQHQANIAGKGLAKFCQFNRLASNSSRKLSKRGGFLSPFNH